MWGVSGSILSGYENAEEFPTQCGGVSYFILLVPLLASVFPLIGGFSFGFDLSSLSSIPLMWGVSSFVSAYNAFFASYSPLMWGVSLHSKTYQQMRYSPLNGGVSRV